MFDDLTKEALISRLKEVENILFQYSQIDGEHHKAWVIDQITRAVFADSYDVFVNYYEYFDELADSYSDFKLYEWDTGIAP